MGAPVQQSVKTNYISIVNDVPADAQATDAAGRSRPGTMKDVIGRLAAVLKRHLAGTPGPHDTP
jgi:hypothetical protein